MSDLSNMIDDTTERILRKIDNWEIPQSDKKYITIEKEVWESTLKASLDRAGKIETLQKQLDIAINTLKRIKTQSELYFHFEEESSTNCDSYAAERSIYDLSLKSLNQIKEFKNE